MSILKIVSGGQTGADRGALDAAIQIGIAHGGWVPKGRLAEDGQIPAKYDLKEMPTDSFDARTEKNVIDSDGTVVLSHGKLTGGSKLTIELAEKHGRPFLHIDFHKIPKFLAAAEINEWVQKRNLEILNVAGPRASGDPKIYHETKRVIESAILMGMVTTDPNQQMQDHIKSEQLSRLPIPPKTVNEAVAHLVESMSLKDKATVANMGKDELVYLYNSLGTYIRGTFRLMHNAALLASCRFYADKKDMDEEKAISVIIEALQQALYTSHRLRVVK